MPRVSEYVVRFNFESECPDVQLLLEFLRYAGVAYKNSDSEIEIRLPAGISKNRSAGWARRNAERINSFGLSFKAVAVPKY